MRITVFGAGAIGGYLAAKLAIAGNVDLSIVARGAHLEAIRADGLRLIENGTETVARVRAAARAEHLGAQDYV
ncbi:MAG: oxidoreductase, partial [Mesorhizobium sp.]